MYPADKAGNRMNLLRLRVLGNPTKAEESGNRVRRRVSTERLQEATREQHHHT